MNMFCQHLHGVSLKFRSGRQGCTANLCYVYNDTLSRHAIYCSPLLSKVEAKDVLCLYFNHSAIFGQNGIDPTAIAFRVSEKMDFSVLKFYSEVDVHVRKKRRLHNAWNGKLRMRAEPHLDRVAL